MLRIEKTGQACYKLVDAESIRVGVIREINVAVMLFYLAFLCSCRCNGTSVSAVISHFVFSCVV